MSNLDQYPTYIKIVDDDESDDIMELPTEKDGTILLSTILAQYPTATGLKFKTDTGSWEEIQLAESVLYPPDEGWGEKEYFVTSPKQDSVKRKNTSSHNGPDAKVVRKTIEEKLLSDLIVLGLTYSATEEEFKNYFETFGELAMHEIKRDPNTQESKGFGFIRYTSAEVAQKVLNMEHTVGGRRCEVRLPKKQDDLPTKLFIGRLKEGTTAEQLREHFSTYGELRDVYVPKNFRGFGFITLSSQEEASSVMEATHIIEGSCVNVTFAEPKGEKLKQRQMDINTQYSGQQSAQGYNTQGYNTQGNNTQGYNTQGYNTQGNNTQGYGAVGHGAVGHGAQGYGTQGYSKQGYSAQQYRPSSFSRIF